MQANWRFSSTQPKRAVRIHLLRQLLVVLVALVSGICQTQAAEPVAVRSRAAQAYLDLIENFLGFAEQHWNEKAESYDAEGSGVTWARGNGAVCLVAATLLTEYPDRESFSPQKIDRKVLLEHVRQTLRTLCFTSNVCTDPRAVKPGTWGGKDPKEKTWHWQAGLETEHWVLATHMLRDQIDADTLALVRQVAGAEADGAAEREISSARPGDTAADDCSWNAGILGVCAAVYADDPRAKKWDEWAKRWALNMEGREPDRTSKRMIDGRPLGEWLVSINAYPDLTIVNHGFWDLPYQTSFADLTEAVVAYKMCNLPIPQAFHANVLEEGENILKWLAMPDGDVLCPQGIDWAERDVQHSWAYTVLGTTLNQPWALAAEARCIDLLKRRQAVFGDGSVHALDFGYETDLARVWTSSFLLHKYFGKPDSGPHFDEPRGAKMYPHVDVAVFRAPDLASSVTWYPPRQAIMISPTNLEAVADRPAFTRWDRESGTGWIALNNSRSPSPRKPKGDSPTPFERKTNAKHARLSVDGKPRILQEDGSLVVSFARQVPNAVRQEIDYCALPNGTVAVFSKWRALKDVDVAEVVDHPFRWVEIEKFISKPDVRQPTPGLWNIDNKLQMQVFGDVTGEQVGDGINGAERHNFQAKAGDVLQESVCVYQPIISGHTPAEAKRDGDSLEIGDWQIHRSSDGAISTKRKASGG